MHNQAAPGDLASGQIPSITTEQRSGDWMAFANNDRRIWECGRSEHEAIGLLVARLVREGSISLTLIRPE